jgi:dTDP-4-dehydrorhamnose reductase
VNAAAYTAVDKAESDSANAQRIIAEAVAVMAEGAAACNATVIHYSTDYVFDGEKQGFYDENAVTNPLGIYGSSKLAGEQALQASSVPHYVLRTSWVYGAHGNNFLKTMLRLARQKEALSVVADQWGAPTGAALIADVTAAMVQQLQMGKKIDSGIYHLVAAGETNWHGYAQHLLTRAVQKGLVMKFDPQSVQAIPTSDYPTPARRPANSRLDCRKLEAALGITLPHWSQGVDQVVDMLMENRAL